MGRKAKQTSTIPKPKVGGGQEERGGEAEVRKPGASRASDVSQGRFFLFLFFVYSFYFFFPCSPSRAVKHIFVKSL